MELTKLVVCSMNDGMVRSQLERHPHNFLVRLHYLVAYLE